MRSRFHKKFRWQLSVAELTSAIRKFKQMRTIITKKLKFFLVAMLLLTQPVFGQTIFGNSDCGQWMNSKTEYRKAWVLGLMSGLSVAINLPNTVDLPTTKQEDWLGKVNSAEQIFLYIDNYCQKMPLGNTLNASLALFSELIKK